MSGTFDRTLSTTDVMRRRATLLQRMHIDGVLLLLLLLLAAGSLFVLYSAGGKSWDLLLKLGREREKIWAEYLKARG